jgi:ABC-type amino acid transport substrate-binding protein
MFIAILVEFLFILPLPAIDEIRFEVGQNIDDVRMQFKLDLLEEAMRKTSYKYGEFRIVTNVPQLNNFRAIDLLQTGEYLNVFIAATNYEWEEKTIPIRIPVRMGLLNYRLLLVHKDELERFEQIDTIEDLKKMRAGSKIGWSLTNVLEKAGFNVISGAQYDGLFLMLNAHRFDFLMRGVNEIYDEMAQIESFLTNIRIEPGIAVYLPSPTYVFVSPQFPELAKRLEEGLEIMVEDGTLYALIQKYHVEDIKKADLNTRRIFYVENPFLPPETPFDRKELWIDLLNE